MIIGVDVDNVISDTSRQVLRLAKKLFGIDINFSEYFSWGYLHEKGYCTLEQEIELYKKVWEEDSFLDMPLVEEESVEVVNRIGKTNMVFFVSARLGGLGETSRVSRYLNYHGFRANGVAYFLKSFYNGTDKAQLGFLDLLVDDSPKTIVDASNSNTIPVLYERPWNRSTVFDPQGLVQQLNGKTNIFRIAKIRQLEEIVNGKEL